MAARLGSVLFWASIFTAIGWTWLNIAVGQRDMTWVYLTDGIIVLTGIAARCVLAGGKSQPPQ